MSSYKKTNWKNWPSRETPLNAESLNNMDDGIDWLFKNKLNKSEFTSFKTSTDSKINGLTSDVGSLKSKQTSFDKKLGSLESDFNKSKGSIEEFYVSVKDFGAKGDGRAIDTKSIQAALDYVEKQGGGVVYLPPGRYKTNDNLFIGNYTALVGAGRSSIIDANHTGTTTQGTSLLRTKYHDNSGAYSGATGFRIENLMITSTDRKFQGIYTDNAKDFVIRNIWGERTLHHYLDINNSKNGVFENLFFQLDSNSCIQFDGRKETGSEESGNGNENMTVKGVFIEGGKLEPNKTTYNRAAFHFHRAPQKGIYISDVFTNNVDTLLYKDADIKCDGITFNNIRMYEFTKPFDIRYLSGTGHSRGWTVSNMYVESNTSIKRAVGRIEGVHDLTLTDYHGTVTGNASHDPVVFDSAVKGWDVRNVRLRGIYHRHQLENIYSYIKDEEQKALLLPQMQTQSTGKWTPTVSYAAGYTRRQGWYVRNGNLVTVFARITLNGVKSDRRGSILIDGLPFPPIDDPDFRGTGAITYISNYKNTSSNSDKMVGTQVAMSSQGVITLQRDGTNEPMSCSQMESNFLVGFTLTYMV